MPTPSRRQFLHLAGFSIAALAMPRLPSWLSSPLNADLPSLGLRIGIPTTWHFVAAAEIEQIRAEVVLPGGEAAKKHVAEMAGVPLLVAARERHPTPGPTLVVWRQRAEADHESAENHAAFAPIHAFTYARYGWYLRDFAVVREGRADRFADRPASSVVVQFRDESVRGTSWLVRLESHMLRWHDSWLTFNFLDLADAWTSQSKAEFQDIEKSLGFYAPRVTGPHDAAES